MRHINHCNTLQDRAVPTDGSFGIPYFMKTRMTGSGTERKERHIQPVADRELQGKVGKRFFSDGKAGPFGFRGKIILARRACGIFPESLAFPEAFAVKPL